MVKYYNGEMYTIPKEFEEEVRADERKIIAEELLSNFMCNKKCTDYTHNCQFAITEYTVEVDVPARCVGCEIKNRIIEIAQAKETKE